MLADKLERLQSKTDTIASGATREVGVQSPSLTRLHRPAPSDTYYYDEVFDLIPTGPGAQTLGSAAIEESEAPVIVEKEKGTTNLVNELCDQEVSNRALSLSLSDEEDSVTPFVSADDGEEDEMIKKIIDAQARNASQ